MGERETLPASAEQRSLAMLVTLHRYPDGILRADLIAAVRALLDDPALYLAPRAPDDARPPDIEERTVHRDLARVREWLGAMPWPAIRVESVSEGRERRYILRQRLVPGFALTDTDRDALREIYRHLCGIDSGVRGVVLPFVQKVTDDMLAVEPGDVLPATVQGALSVTQRDALDVILREKAQRRGVRFAYRANNGREGVYTVYPTEVSWFASRVYIGAKKEDGVFRTFRLDRIVPRPSLPDNQQMVEPTGRVAPFGLSPPSRPFVLRVTDHLVAYFQDTAVFPDQHIHPADSGAILLSGTFRSAVLLANQVLRYGAAVELREPAYVRAMIAEEVTHLAVMYASGADEA